MNDKVVSSPIPMAHPPRSNPFRRSSSVAPPLPCITPSTVTWVMVVSLMVVVPSRWGAHREPPFTPTTNTSARIRQRLAEGSPVVSGGRPDASVHGMTSVRLTVLALTILAASAVAGIAAYAAGVVDPGITYGFSQDDTGHQTLVVASVRPGGLAWHEGVEPGYIALSVEEVAIGGGLGEQVYT